MGRLVEAAPGTRSKTRAATGGSAHELRSNEDQYLERVAKYIPAEILAGYLTINGIIQSVNPDDPVLPYAAWTSFILCLVLTPIYFNALARAGQPKWLHITVSTLAFVVWAYALGGVFTLTGTYKPWLASLVLVIFTLVSGLLEPRAAVVNA
jgi:hypothetical protein